MPDGTVTEQMARGMRALDAAQTRQRAAIEHAAAVRAGLRTHVHDPIGVPHQAKIVLDHEQRVTRPFQLIESRDERLGVGRMQAGRRLVEHVDHAEEIRANLGRETQSLQLAGR